jgi:DNA invertase Pin-like site-specific DNA recombinase
MVRLLAVFAESERDILRERVKAGIAQARAEGKPHGRPRTASLLEHQLNEMHEAGMSKSEIARRLSIGRTSVRRILADNGRSQFADIGAEKAEER